MISKKTKPTRLQQLLTYIKKSKKGRTYTELSTYLSVKLMGNGWYAPSLDRGLLSKYIPVLREMCTKEDNRYVYNG